MMKSIKGLTEYFRRKNQEAAERRRHELLREAVDYIQPMVWNGKMYIAVGGEPIVEASLLRGDIVEEISKMQTHLAVFREV